ncbi:thymidylate synthase [Rhizoctonia solani AG-1 IB]|nr:thymidylate synthase [Rhizoctonia solani AG-1 IB]
MFCQFYVHLADPSVPDAKNGLSCIMYQRSADLGLGIPFNIASYAFLTHMIARVTNTEPRELIMQLGDAHVYRDHVDALKIQLEREPRPFPTLTWADRDVPTIDDFVSGDFVIEGYKPHGKIEMKMSV